MIDTDGREFRELVAQLSDGTLTAENARRLNAILEGDPIAQQLCLSHLFVDGLLEREFETGGIAPCLPTGDEARSKGSELLPSEPPSVSTRGSRSYFRGPRLLLPLSLVAASLALLVWSCWYWWIAERVHTSTVLADSGFERHSPLVGAAAPAGVWCGDPAELVGVRCEIDPLEGARMLAFREPAEGTRSSCMVYQIVDLDGHGKLPKGRTVSVSASAHFNAAIDRPEEACLLSIKLFGFSEKPVYIPGIDPSGWGQSIVFAGRQLIADVDQDSWQHASARLILPSEARYVVIHLSVIDPVSATDADFERYFVDKVEMKLVSSR